MSGLLLEYEDLQDFYAIRHLKNHQCTSGKKSHIYREIYEWIGDALLDELIGRSILVQFHPQVIHDLPFHPLCRSIVRNSRLSIVFKNCGLYEKNIPHGISLKYRADTIEAIIGEAFCRMKSPLVRKDKITLYGEVIDRILSDLVSQETEACGEKLFSQKDPIFNQFECLDELNSEDELMESTETSNDVFLEETEEKNDENKDEMNVYGFDLLCTDVVNNMKRISNPSDSLVASMHWGLKKEILKTKNNLIIKEHANGMIPILNSYGSSVLSCLVSQILFNTKCGKENTMHMTPKELTLYRLEILNKNNLAKCAQLLDICKKDETASISQQANALRSLLGYISYTSTWTLLNRVALFLVYNHKDIISTKISFQTFVQENVADVVCISMNYLPKTLSSIRNLFISQSLIKQVHSDSILNNIINLQDLESVDSFPIHTHVVVMKSKKKKKKGKFQKKKKKKTIKTPNAFTEIRKSDKALSRFITSPFLYQLEEIIILFAKKEWKNCETLMNEANENLSLTIHMYQLETEYFVLSIEMENSFYRLLLHSLCEYHHLSSETKSCPEGNRITHIRHPEIYDWYTNGPGQRYTKQNIETSLNHVI